VFRYVLGSEGCVLVPRSSGTPVATWAWPTWVVSRRRVLEAMFILLEFPSPSRRNLSAPIHSPLSGSPYRSFSLYTSFDQDHDLVCFSSLEHQTNHATFFNARGLLYECIFDALLFSSSYRPVGKPVSHHVVTRPTFSSLLFFGSSYRPSCPP
jgi:hypothetical protein